MARFKLAVLGSLADGYSMIPYLVFSSLVTGDPNRVNFFVPIVVVYTVQRACLVSLRGFGEIINPYLIMKRGLFTAAFGALLMTLYTVYAPLLTIGSLLVAMGLAPYGSMFAPMSEKLAERFPEYPKSRKIGKIIYFALIILICAFGKAVFPLIAFIFFVYILLALASLCFVDGAAFYPEHKSFDTSKREPVFFLFGVLTVLCLLVLRQYKQSGESYLVWIAPLTMIVALIAEKARMGANYPNFVYKTYWAGAVNNFLILFNILYHASVKNRSVIILIYVAIALGGVCRSFISRALMKRVPAEKFDGLCMILSAAFSFLCIVPVPAVNFIGIIICTAISGIVASNANKDYLNDGRHVVNERALARRRIYSTGCVINQVVLLFAVYLIGECCIGKNLLYAYANGIPDSTVGHLLRIAGLICCTILMVSAVLIANYTFKGEKKPNG